MNKKQFIVSVIADFAPIIAFVVATELAGFMIALLWLVAVAILSVIIEWTVSRRPPKFGLVASVTIFLFGVLSIVTGDEFYIIIKDTLYALSFAVALLLGLLFKRSYLEVLFGDYFAITRRGWFVLTYRWIIFFFLLAITNEFARTLLVPDVWIYYKLVAVLSTWVFGFYQLTLTKRERLPEANTWGLRQSQ
ncbi:hypothetical protein GW937_01600 [Candidatus Kaiserbacteria bacterium]|nr:hypothetical protein [Candidatus Kaiserbacteria bacterium]NCT01708.1 hypothetical protein [Candidatus Parcubacteria bacterium]